MGHLLRYMRKRDIGLTVLCVLLVAGQVFLDLRMPDYTKEITLLISSETNVISDYFAAGGKMLACAFGSALLAVVVGYLAASIAADFSYDIRGRVFAKVSDFGAGEINRFSTASLITRTTNDITQIQMVVAMGLQVLIKAPIMAVWAIMKIIGKSWELSVLTASAVVIIVTVIGILMAVLIPKFKIVQKQVDDVNRVTRENLTGLKVVRAFNAEKYQEDRFEQANGSLMKTQLFTTRGMAFLFPVMMFVQSGLSLGIYWLGAWLIDDIAIPLDGTAAQIFKAIGARADLLGDVVAFNSYALYVVMSFVLLLMIFVMLPRAQVSADRINEVLHADIAVKEGTMEGTDLEEKGTIEFRNVSFRYPNAAENCLENISFKAEKGQTIAVIGATGSGKSTLVGLAARLYDATEGEVRIDGKDVREYSFHGLYNKLGYVTQKAVLFSDTIENNVAFGEAAEKVERRDVEHALDIAQGTEFVTRMEEGLDSKIAQSGSNLSGGQKQRLAIARAVARKSEILIFDDSFSALDYKTDKELRKRLSSDLQGTTCVIVAQRIGTIRHADKIIVLEDGKAVGIGTHEELMKNCSVYQEIALSQLSQAELA
ncbi:MAG: ABC transporter ATP-binding protein [Hominisplanchenecus sp.]